MGSLRKAALEPWGPFPYHPTKFQLDASKHYGTHIAGQTDRQTDRQSCFFFNNTRAPVGAYALKRYWSHVVALGIFCPLVDPLLLMRDLRPQQCITLWSGILVAKCDGQWSFPKNLTMVDPG